MAPCQKLVLVAGTTIGDNTAIVHHGLEHSKTSLTLSDCKSHVINKRVLKIYMEHRVTQNILRKLHVHFHNRSAHVNGPKYATVSSD